MMKKKEKKEEEKKKKKKKKKKKNGAVLPLPYCSAIYRVITSAMSFSTEIRINVSCIAHDSSYCPLCLRCQWV